MHNSDEEYMQKIEFILEHFGTIQKNFVLEKTGIEAVIKLIEDLSRGTPSFSIDDPILIKGKDIILKITEELNNQLKQIGKIKPPVIWRKFHQALADSIGLQLEGYIEMAKIFNDYRMQHIHKGRHLVNQGLSLLECGEKSEVRPR